MQNYSFAAFENRSTLETLNNAVVCFPHCTVILFSANSPLSNTPQLQNQDSYTAWEALVLEVEQLDGGLNRNSPPDAIALFRAVYDAFLAKFPLFFGFWKKYAHLEFTIGGTEVSEHVYERGVSAVPLSTDLWASYCAFVMETTHNVQLIRE